MSNFDLIAFDEMAQIRACFQSNDTERVHATLSKLRDSLDDEIFRAKTIPLLYEAVEKSSFHLICCFLENHVPMDSQLVVKATTNTSYQALEAFLIHGWDINAPVDWDTPAPLAFSFHDSALTKWFLSHGADPNRRCYEHTDRTPLSIAFKEAPFTTIQLLLDHGASLKHGQVMHYAAMRELDDRLEVLQYLLVRGHSVNDIMYQNCGDEYYFHMYSGIGAPLHYAAGRGLLDSVKLLVQHGASPQIRDPLGRTAADWARKNGHIAIFDFLRPLSTGRDLESNFQFTDTPGRHIRTTPLEEVIIQNGFRLV